MNPPELQKSLERALASHPLGQVLTFRPMFGGIFAYVHGLGFASLSDVGLAFKLATADQPELLALEGAKFLQYDPSQPISKQYVVVPPALLQPGKEEQLAYWATKSEVYVSSLPLKIKKPKSKK